MRWPFIIAISLAVMASGTCRAQNKAEEPIISITPSARTPFLFDVSLDYCFGEGAGPYYVNRGGTDLLLMSDYYHYIGASFDVRAPRLRFLTAGASLGAQVESIKSRSSWSGTYPRLEVFKLVPNIHFTVDLLFLYSRFGVGCSILLNNNSSFKDPDPVYASLGTDCLTPSIYYHYIEVGVKNWRISLAGGVRHIWNVPFDLDKLSYYKRYQFASSVLDETMGGKELYVKVAFQLFSNHR